MSSHCEFVITISLTHVLLYVYPQRFLEKIKLLKDRPESQWDKPDLDRTEQEGFKKVGQWLKSCYKFRN